MKRILLILGTLVLSGCSALAQPTAVPTIEVAVPEPIQATVAPTAEIVASEPAILSEIENDVAVRAKNETDWKNVSAVELVNDGGSVRTQAESSARLDLPNGNVLLIGSDTIFELSNVNDHNWVIFLEQGGVALEVTADHLGGSLIKTPIGIAWPTGSILGVTYALSDGFGVTADYMGVGCFKGSCAATQGEFHDEFSLGMTWAPITGLTIQTEYGYDPISLRGKEQLTVEKKTDSEPTASEIQPLDFSKNSSWVTPLIIIDVLAVTLLEGDEEENEAGAAIDPSNVDTGGENTAAIGCDLFQGAMFSHVYGEWLPGAPLAVNIKMPASVAWQDLNYKMKIGDVEGQVCAPLEGNNTRLSCKIKLPSEYVSTYKYHLSLHQEGCEEPIYTKGPLSLPAPEPSDEPKDEGEEETNSCDAYAPDQIACESGGGIWDLVFFSCTCP